MMYVDMSANGHPSYWFVNRPTKVIHSMLNTTFKSKFKAVDIEILKSDADWNRNERDDQYWFRNALCLKPPLQDLKQ